MQNTQESMQKLTLISFGFKYGSPNANYYFDVSFAKNPARESQWSLFDQPDNTMVDFVLSQPKVNDFVKTLLPMLDVIVTLDDDARIAFGCNAGRHRFAIIVEHIAGVMRAKGMHVDVIHREWKQ